MRMLRRLLLVPAALLAAACADAEVPTATPAPEAPQPANAAAQQAPSPNIVDLLLQTNVQSGEFSTLIAPVVAADLVGPLSSQGQGTIFAPTDDAFAALGMNAGNVGTLPKSDLLNILGYHTAPGRHDAASVVAAGALRMANGQLAQITVEDGMVYIENARILVTDIAAANGIVHVIDAVLLP